MHLLKDPGILIVLFTFFGIVSYVIYKYRQINKELVNVIAFLEKFTKADLVFRFNELESDCR